MDQRSPVARVSFQSQCSLSAALERHRSEEHTSELQSHVNLVCRLLLEKKKHRHGNGRHLRNLYIPVLGRQIYFHGWLYPCRHTVHPLLFWPSFHLSWYRHPPAVHFHIK